MSQYTILSTVPKKGYELLDSGDGEKLERYGDIIVARPDPQALWPKSLSEEEWKKVTAVFTRESTNAGWEFKKKIPERWQINFQNLNFWIKPTSFKHTGLFPEQSSNWKWIQEQIKQIDFEELVGIEVSFEDFIQQAVIVSLTLFKGIMFFQDL
jgi:23S rRNA G2069 N7-methylase RlmK/C1962 C5-methylase RlmI